MDVFTMVVIIVFIACASGAATQYIKSGAKGHAKVDQAVHQALDDLRARVAVLEQIVTDEKYDLAEEINRLDGREGQQGRS